MMPALALAAALAGCVVVPRTTTTYDPDCGVQTRQMVLDVQQIGYLAGCSNHGCATLLVAAGVVTAASAIVSGSIAVVGNVLYWAERKGQCGL
jgi:hypothetical protein